MTPVTRTNRLKIWCFVTAAACAIGAAACTGNIVGGDPEGKGATPGGSGSGGPGSVPPGTNPGGVTLTCDTSTDPGVSPLMRLSTVQYRNTVRDLLAVSGAEDLVPEIEDLLDSIPDDSLNDGFRGLDDRVALEHVQGYFNVGVAVGDALLDDPDLLTAVAGSCAAEETLSDQCFEDFANGFLRLSQRRPLSEDEVADYASLNDGTRSSAEAIRAMVIVALSSPRFVNQFEIDGTSIDDREDLLQLSAYEIASRLSYTFWQTMPDAELWSSAEDGSLATDEGFAEQLERVFADERTHETLWQFWNEWMRFEKFTGFEASRPGFRALAEGESLGEDGHDHYADMVQEVRDLTELFTFQQPDTLSALLTTDLSVTPSSDLARLYGVEPYSGGDYPRLPEGTRAGLLQRGAVLASSLEQTNPFHRGAMVRRQFLCDALPTPDPNDLPPGSLDPPPIDLEATTRERFQAKVENNTLCQGCHGGFSEIGYVLEAFDALGRFRTVEQVFDEENGDLLAELDIDTSGSFDLGGETVSVSGPVELNQTLVESGRIDACLADQYFRYASRRLVAESSLDECVIQDLAQRLSDPEVGLAGAFQRVAQYASFFQRKVGPR